MCVTGGCGGKVSESLTVFTDGAALLRLVHGVDALGHGAVRHHTVNLIVWLTAAPLAGRRLGEGGEREQEGRTGKETAH